MPWILDEDAAMKTLVSGLVVSDEKNAHRSVKAWFGMPDVEVRTRTYPFLTIDLIGLAEDRPRQRAGPYFHEFAYVPDGFPAKGVTDTYNAAIPAEAYLLTYQVSSWARNPRHDRQLLSQLLSGPLPLRWGVVPVGSGAAANMRRLDVQRMDKRDTADHDGKRLFRNVFTCQMSSELFFWQIEAVKRATSLVLDITQTG